MRINRLRATFGAGGVALGTLIWETRGRGVVHTLAAAGMDFVMICTEHSAYNLETVVDLVAHAAGITPIVRIPRPAISIRSAPAEYRMPEPDRAARKDGGRGAALRRVREVPSGGPSRDGDLPGREHGI
jgi:hypothetical protein